MTSYSLPLGGHASKKARRNENNEDSERIFLDSDCVPEQQHRIETFLVYINLPAIDVTMGWKTGFYGKQFLGNVAPAARAPLPVMLISTLA